MNEDTLAQNTARAEEADEADDVAQEELFEIWLTMIAALGALGYVEEASTTKLAQDALAAGHTTMPITSAREALDWLIIHRYADEQTEREVTASLMQQLRDGTFARANIEALPVLSTLDRCFEAPIEQFLRRRRRIARLKLAGKALAFCAVFGGVVAYVFFPSTPGCDSGSTRRTLRSIALDAGVDATMHNPQVMLSDGRAPLLSFSHKTEVGYDDATGTRACVAQLVTDGKESATKVGYVVERDAGSRRDFRVRMLPVEFVMARYTGIALDRKLGAPVGREAMRDAFMAGLREIDNEVAAQMPSYGQKQPGDDDSPKTLVESVSGVRPTADCHALDANRYACPMQIEFRDKLLDAVGVMPYRLLKNEFVFERGGSGWKMAAGFDQTFMQTISKGRLTPADAAAILTGGAFRPASETQPAQQPAQ